MAQGSQKKFYRNGPDSQKRADLSFHVRRVGAHDIVLWTPEQKRELKKFIDECELRFKLFKAEIDHLCQL